ncbi:MAG TPA: YbhB/YbcL family Raf kinase inhibitor-like protein [Chitinophagaceae bacterium]|nr:YbhB/YbcL family Raf kinase inhibitor-like protein [Chitinophagaceae bacterium]
MKQQLEATSAVDYKQLKVASSVFDENDFIPAKYSCEGEDVNPPLTIENIPGEAKTLAIIVDDPDAREATWVHWVMWNIPVTHHLKENHVPGVQGINDFGRQRYNGPCPPRGTHHYYFKIYALNSVLDIPEDSNKLQLEKAMSNHIIAFGERTGLYTRRGNK